MAFGCTSRRRGRRQPHEQPDTSTDLRPLSNVTVTTPPVMVGQTSIPGSVWLMIPSGNQLFALGNDDSANSSQVSLKYLDVTDVPTMPKSIAGSPANFGNGWAWTLAAQTFKAFTNATQLRVSWFCLSVDGTRAPASTITESSSSIFHSPRASRPTAPRTRRDEVERGIFCERTHHFAERSCALGRELRRSPLSRRLPQSLRWRATSSRRSPPEARAPKSPATGGGTTRRPRRSVLFRSRTPLRRWTNRALPTRVIPGVDARVFTRWHADLRRDQVFRSRPPAARRAAGLSTGRFAPGMPQQCYVWQEQVAVVDVFQWRQRRRAFRIAFARRSRRLVLGTGAGGFFW